MNGIRLEDWHAEIVRRIVRQIQAVQAVRTVNALLQENDEGNPLWYPVLVLIQSSKIHLHYSGVGSLYSALALWDLGPLTLSGHRRRPDREYSRPHSSRAPSCRCCLVSASKGSRVLIGPKCDRQNPTTG